MLIPIGQEDSTVRRTPWIAFAIIALNLMAAVPVFMNARVAELTIANARRALSSFLSEHPYLELPRELAPLVGEEFLRQLAVERTRQIEEGALPEPAELEQEQQQLVERTRVYVEARLSTPWQKLGFVPARPSPPALLTHMFVHSGWLHLLGNMLMFFALGPFLEDVLGRALFAALYLASGLAAVFAHAVYFAGSEVPIVGASGAIAGVMGAFLIRLGGSRIKFLFLPLLVLPFYRVQLLLRGYVVLPAWFLFQHWSASHAVDGAVAYWAHVGGFAFGLVVAGIVRLLHVEERWINPGIEKQISVVQDPALERASDARLAGDLLTARREVRKALAAAPASLDAWSESCRIALDAADAAELDRAAPRLLELYARAGEHGLAWQLIREITREHARLASPKFLLAAAGYHERTGDSPSALELYEQVAELCPAEEPGMLAWYRRGEVYRRAGDTSRARAAFTRARRHPACQAHWPARIDGVLALLEGAAATVSR